jgi:hypothetical protein
MLLEQLVCSSCYLMLLQFKDGDEAPEGFVRDMVSNAKFAPPYVFALFISRICSLCPEACVNG